MDQPQFSVVIPVYREAARIAALLAQVAQMPAPGGAEFLVVDGDPERSTLAAVPEGAAVRLASAKGRARQMNAGAAAAQGGILLFLHADTRLSQEAFGLIQSALADPDICGGAFSLRIVSEKDGPKDAQPGLDLRFITWAANLRARLYRAPYGDQAIFLRRESFEALGGFADLPLMEDLELMTRLRRSGRKIRLLDACVVTSARRWEKEGLLLCTGRNLLLRALYHLGVPARRLVRFYP